MTEAIILILMFFGILKVAEWIGDWIASKLGEID